MESSSIRHSVTKYVAVPRGEPVEVADKKVAEGESTPAERPSVSGHAEPTIAVSDQLTCTVSEGKARCRYKDDPPLELPFDGVTGVFSWIDSALCVATPTEAVCGVVGGRETWSSYVTLARRDVVEVRFHLPNIAVREGTVCSLDKAQVFRCDRFSEAGLTEEVVIAESVRDFAMGPYGGTWWAKGEVQCIEGPGWQDGGRARRRNSGPPAAVPGISGARRVSVGSRRACAAHDNGDVSCWGYGWELPRLGAPDLSPVVRRVPKVHGVKDLTVGDYSVCVASEKGGGNCRRRG